MGCGGGDAGAVSHFDGRRRGFDEAAITGFRGGGIERAADIDGSRLHAAKQGDDAVTVFHRARFDHAGVVDHAGEQGIFCAGGHDHLAAVGLNQLPVLGQVVERALVHLHLQQAVAAEGQGGGAAGAECHGTQPGADGTLIADGVAKQGHIAAIGGMQDALVDDAAGPAAAEGSAVAAEAGVVEIQGGGDQAPDIDLGALAEQDAVGIDQPHLSVGVEVPEDLRAIGVEDAVDGDGGA
ncbi:hypothetical protein GALL_364310 [mine drainage metagenome]|uniref:Uncharacterized protein n=1 Tax=mine drainage metagenome TaxID=410659 RepID=A0A1J5QPH9_9ZZZZ